MPILFSNNASTLLASNLGTGVTTATVTAATGSEFPEIVSPDYCICTLQDSGGNVEYIKVTAHTAGADTFTIERAQEGTTDQSWSTGDLFELRLTAGSLSALSTDNVSATRDSVYVLAIDDGSSLNTYVLTMNNGVGGSVATSYTNGMKVLFMAPNTNTGAATINIDGLGTKSIRYYDSSILGANAIRINAPTIIYYDSLNDYFTLSSGGTGVNEIYPQVPTLINPNIFEQTQTIKGANPLTFDGITADANTTTINVENPTAVNVWTLPNTTDRFIGRDTTDTVNNKTLTSPVINGGNINTSNLSGTNISTSTLISPTINTSITGSAIVTDTTLTTVASDTIPSSEAVKTYIDNTVVTHEAVVTTTGSDDVELSAFARTANVIHVAFSGLSLDLLGDEIVIQLSANSTYKIAGYTGGATAIDTNTLSNLGALNNTGILIHPNLINSDSLSGIATLMHTGSNTWVWSGTSFESNGDQVAHFAGTVTLAGTIDGLRLSSTGSRIFDAMNARVTYY